MDREIATRLHWVRLYQETDNAGLSHRRCHLFAWSQVTRPLAVELGCDGVTVNCICPGPLLTGAVIPVDGGLMARNG